MRSACTTSSCLFFRKRARRGDGAQPLRPVGRAGPDRLRCGRGRWRRRRGRRGWDVRGADDGVLVVKPVLLGFRLLWRQLRVHVHLRSSVNGPPIAVAIALVAGCGAGPSPCRQSGAPILASRTLRSASRTPPSMRRRTVTREYVRAVSKVPSLGECTVDGWCWTNPFPQGGDLYAAFGSAPTDLWFVGVGGTILHGDGRDCSLAGLVGSTLRGGWAASPCDAWAVGDNGTIARWNGIGWAASAVATAPLAAASGDSASDVWAVGSYGTTLRSADSALGGRRPPPPRGLSPASDPLRHRHARRGWVQFHPEGEAPRPRAGREGTRRGSHCIGG